MAIKGTWPGGGVEPPASGIASGVLADISRRLTISFGAIIQQRDDSFAEYDRDLDEVDEVLAEMQGN